MKTRLRLWKKKRTSGEAPIRISLRCEAEEQNSSRQILDELRILTKDKGVALDGLILIILL